MKEIRNIIEMYDQTDFSKEKLALAVVVHIEESAYRRVGARMLVSSSGRWIGGISGGCLEGDALKRSQAAIFKNEACQVTYNTLDQDENQIGIGLGCEGKIDVLFVPINPKDPKNPVLLLKQIVKNNTSAIQIQIINASPSSFPLGTTEIIQDELPNLMLGIIGKEQLSHWLETTRLNRRPQIVEFIDKNDHKVKLLLEYIRPETKLVIVGDNYDVTALMTLAFEMGWEIHLVGRKKKMTKDQFRMAANVYEYEHYDQISISEYTAVVLMTHDFDWDSKLLPQILRQKPSYVGMLGPKKRLKKMEEELGIAKMNDIPFFHSPVGLDIGAETPEEIGLSILAEIIAAFRSRKGGHLRFRDTTIHERIHA